MWLSVLRLLGGQAREPSNEQCGVTRVVKQGSQRRPHVEAPVVRKCWGAQSRAQTGWARRSARRRRYAAVAVVVVVVAVVLVVPMSKGGHCSCSQSRHCLVPKEGTVLFKTLFLIQHKALLFSKTRLVLEGFLLGVLKVSGGSPARQVLPAPGRGSPSHRSLVPPASGASPI